MVLFCRALAGANPSPSWSLKKATHWPLAHWVPEEQAAPFGLWQSGPVLATNAVVLMLGLQTWQELVGLVAPKPKQVPPMLQP
jgi:hypothetical protein